MLPLLSLIYADLFNRCLFSCLVPTSASRHPCRFERTRSHTLTPPPAPPRLLPTLWPKPHGSVSEGVMCGSRNGRRLLRDWMLGCCCSFFFLTRAHSEISFSLLNRLTSSESCRLGKAILRSNRRRVHGRGEARAASRRVPADSS